MPLQMVEGCTKSIKNKNQFQHMFFYHKRIQKWCFIAPFFLLGKESLAIFDTA
jgi:hypothetical protein